VVLQVAADVGRVGDDVDAVPAQQRRRADPRELQQVRRLQRAGGDDHLGVGVRDAAFAAARRSRAGAVDPLDAARLPGVDDDPRHLRAGRDRQVRRARAGARNAVAASQRQRPRSVSW
jgi:hypothetical protein